MEDEILSALEYRRKIARERLLSIPSIAANPISERLVDSFSKDGDLDLAQLVRGLREFVHSSSLDPKIRLIFKIYDRNRQSRITESDLFHILKMLDKQGLDDNKLWNIVDKTFAELGNYPSYIGLSEFHRLIAGKTNNIDEFFKTGED